MAAVPVRPIVALRLPTRIKNLITFAQSIGNAMNNNASFPTPNPPIATLLANVQALSTAEAEVLSRTKGAVQTRNTKLAAVRADLDTLKTYVQSVAGGAGTPENAQAVVGVALSAHRRGSTSACAEEPSSCPDGPWRTGVDLRLRGGARFPTFGTVLVRRDVRWTPRRPPEVVCHRTKPPSGVRGAIAALGASRASAREAGEPLGVTSASRNSKFSAVVDTMASIVETMASIVATIAPIAVTIVAVVATIEAIGGTIGGGRCDE
jgi:hypothetical protein